MDGKRKKLILVGAGGHAKSVVDCISDKEYELLGFLDENKTGFFLNKPILGKNIEDICDFRQYYYFVSIGNNQFRREWFERLLELQVPMATIIDSTAIVSRSAKVGKGCFIGKYAVLNADSEIGDNCIINTRALVEHECHLGNHIHVSTNAVINGNVNVSDGTFIGSCAVINGQLSIGRDSTIGSGAAVIKCVDDCVTVVGVPAKVVKKNGCALK